MRPATITRTLAALAAILAATLTLPATTATASPSRHTVACPHITAVTPGTGPAAGGYNVTITGTGLANVTSVQFGAGDYSPAFITTPAGTSIEALVPAGWPRKVHLIVTTPEGFAKFPFTYTAAG